MRRLCIDLSAVDNSLIGERNAHFKRKNVARGKNEFSFLSVYIYVVGQTKNQANPRLA
jgi:hypothetical protein